MVDVEPPGCQRAEIGGEPEKGKQAIGFDPACVAREVGEDDGGELAGLAAA